MSKGFQDSFTKEDTKEDVLGSSEVIHLRGFLYRIQLGFISDPINIHKVDLVDYMSTL